MKKFLMALMLSVAATSAIAETAGYNSTPFCQCTGVGFPKETSSKAVAPSPPPKINVQIFLKDLKWQLIIKYQWWWLLAAGT